MKTILVSINAKYIHTNNAVRLLKANCDFDVEILEYTIKDPIETIINDIKKLSPDIIGFSCYIWNISIIETIIPQLISSGLRIILGGPEVSYEPVYFLQKLSVDYIIQGEGEIAFNLLLEALKSNNDVSHIPNLSHKENGVIKRGVIQEIMDLDSIQLPYYFEDDIPHIKHRIAYLESSRGCPYKCSYCLSSLEERVRFFPLQKVKQAIVYLMKHGAKTIKFLDRTFNANRNTLELLEFIIQVDNNQTTFQFEITGDILDPKIIDYIHQHAREKLFRFEIGIQSINYETNYLVDRIQDNEKLFSNIKKIQERDIIDLHLDLIAGLPKEDLESFKFTFNQVFKLGAKELQLGFLKMLRGTKIRLEADKYNYVYHQVAPYEIISNDVLSNSDIQIIKDVEHMLEMYHNKGYFGNYLKEYLLSLESPFDFFLKLAAHYHKNNYPFHGYQIEDVYLHLFEILPDDVIHSIKKDYLLRSFIKPKQIFPVIKDKTIKKELFDYVSKVYSITTNDLYRHSVIIDSETEYFIVYYSGNQNKSYTIQKEDIS